MVNTISLLYFMQVCNCHAMVSKQVKIALSWLSLTLIPFLSLTIFLNTTFLERVKARVLVNIVQIVSQLYILLGQSLIFFGIAFTCFSCEGSQFKIVGQSMHYGRLGDFLTFPTNNVNLFHSLITLQIVLQNFLNQHVYKYRMLGLRGREGEPIKLAPL